MKNKLQDILLDYIRTHHPELLKRLIADDSLHAWILEKLKVVDLVLAQSLPLDTLEAACMEQITAGLRPNRHRYIRDLFEERFTSTYQLLLVNGLLHYELVAMTALCHDVFEQYALIEGMDQTELDHQAISIIHQYLQTQYPFA